MIIDKITNSNIYSDINPKITKVLELITKTDYSTLPEGKTEIDGNELFVMHANNTTYTEEHGYWESHKDYIDVQYIIEGEEVICWESLLDEGCKLVVDKEYDKEKDLIIYKGGVKNPLFCNKGTFLVLYPHDAHMTNITLDKETTVKKVIYKIKI